MYRLLEHSDPQRLIDEFKRILKPYGELVISASAVFSYEGPDNFFHFTPYGFEILFKDWSKIANAAWCEPAIRDSGHFDAEGLDPM